MFRKIFFLVFLFSVGLSAQNTTQSVGFKENKGQIVDQKGNPNPDVLYLLNTGGLNVQLRKNGFSYDVYETKKNPLTEKDKRRQENIMNYEDKPNSLPDYSLEYIYHRVDIDFEGSNPNAELIKEGKSKDYDNYYTLKHAPEGILMVYQYQKITYKDLYPNIDVVFFIPEDISKTVEYNFIIRPGGKASNIRMKFNGVKTDLADGKIKIQTRFGTMEETLPLSWAEEGGERQEIAVGYKRLKKNLYGFSVAEQDVNKIIVIDPVPVRLWGTYYGGFSLNLEVSSINEDGNSNVIMTGETHSSNNIATVGAFVSENIDHDGTGYVVKFNSTGQRIWGSYVMNGSNETIITDCKVNSEDEIYIVGTVWDGGAGINLLATANAHKTIPSVLYTDGYILKFNENGVRIWGTFFGGDETDGINSLVLDEEENIIISGSTYSDNGIATSDGFLTSNPINSIITAVGFFSKFTPNGNQIYGSYYYIPIEKSARDVDGNYYFSGIHSNNSSYPNISTPDAHQTSTNEYYNDTYLVKFNASYTLQWCTYYGGDHNEILKNIGTDGLKNIYLIGTTESTQNIASPGSLKDSMMFGSLNGFIAKFDTDGQRLWGTYFGRNGTLIEDNCNDGFVKEDGSVFIAGETIIYPGYPELSTPNSFQPISNGSDEGFFAKLNTNGNLEWCSYYGTISQDYLQKIYSKNFIYVGGYSSGVASQGNNLGTPGTHMPTGGGYKAFIGKFQDCLSAPQVDAINPCIGSDLELTASGGTSYFWTGPNGFTSSLQNPTIANATPLVAGEYFCTVTGTGGCDDTISIIVTVGDTIAPVPDVAILPTITGTCNQLTIPIPTATDACMGNIIATTTSPLVYTLEGTYTIVWEYNDGTNVATQNQTIVIEPQPLPVANANVFFCIQENKTLADITITGQDIKWYDEATAGTLLPNTTLLENGYTYYASQTIDGCESERIPVTATIQDTFGPSGFAVQYFCDTESLTLADFVLTGTEVVFYDSQFGGSVLPMTTPLVDDMGYWASQTVNGCESSLRTPFISDIISDLPANNYTVNVCDNLNDGSEEVDLSDYEEVIIPASSNYSFSYYTDYTSADIGNTANEITDFNAYDLQLGMNSIYVRVENATLCYKVVLLELNLIATPILNMLDTYGLCEGRSTTLTADPGFYTYTWSTGALSQSIVVTEPGNYGVTVTGYHGDVICGTTKNITVVASNVATITSIETSDWTSDENMLTVLVTGLGDYEYSLDGIHYQSSNQFIGLEDGEYTVYVRDINGCGIAKEDAYLLMYPKFFTPNADGYNDVWGIKFYQNEPSMVVKIFDRYGKFIKQLTDTDPTWDGTYNGTAETATDYWFTVIRANGEEHKGHFSLKR